VGEKGARKKVRRKGDVGRLQKGVETVIDGRIKM